MKKKLLILLCALMATITASAYDFSIEKGYESYSFTITGSNTCELSKCTSTRTFGDYTSTGVVKVPSSVENEGITYQVTSIGDNAFSGLEYIINLELPNSVTSMGIGVFKNCPILAKVVLPNTLTSIPESTFEGCQTLGSVNIPEMVTSIGNRAFLGCWINLKSIALPNTLTSIGTSAFVGCKALTSITLPNSITYIGSYSFRSCTELTSIKIPGLVSEIGEGAFKDCNKLTRANIPYYVTVLQSETFSGCTSLSSLYIYHANPSNLKIKSQALKSVPRACQLYVPRGSKDKYTSNSTWKNYTTIIDNINNTSVDIDESDMATLWFNYKATIPEGVEVFWAESVVDNNGDPKVKLVKIDDKILPSYTGVIVKGDIGKVYDFIEVDIPSIPVSSILVGTSIEQTFGNDGYNYYQLTHEDNYPSPETFGFYLANSDGTINAEPYKAYLKLPKSMNLSNVGLTFNDDTTTSIEGIEVDTQNDNIYYDLMGRKVVNPTQGIYIQNGRKVFVK